MDDDLERLLRRVRRSALEARTLTMTLRSSIATLDEIPGTSPETRAEVRRTWCAQVTAELAQVRTVIERNRSVAAEIAERHANELGPVRRARLTAELASADEQLAAFEDELRALSC